MTRKPQLQVQVIRVGIQGGLCFLLAFCLFVPALADDLVLNDVPTYSLYQGVVD